MGNVACIGVTSNVHRFLVRKPEGIRLLGISRHSREDNTNMTQEKYMCELDSSGSVKGLWWVLVNYYDLIKGGN